MIRALIIDKNKSSVCHLKRLLKASGNQLEVVHSLTSLEEAESLIKRTGPEILFLEIEGQYHDSFELLCRLKPSSAAVIITTSNATYAVKAFKHNVFDYLLKPLKKEEVEASIKKLRQKLEYENIIKHLHYLKRIQENQDFLRKICIPTFDGFIYIKPAEIIRCQADINYTHIYLTSNKKITVSKSIRYFELLLKEHNFFRIHKSHLINLMYLTKYTKGKGGYVTLSDQSEIAVSTRKKQAFLEQLSP